MKNRLLLWCFLILSIALDSQSFVFEHERGPSLRKEQMMVPTRIGDIIKDYPAEYYRSLIDYVAVDISATCNGNTRTATGSSEALTEEQKAIVTNADPGTELKILISFKYKETENDGRGSGRKIKEMSFVTFVCPDQQAQFAGGEGRLELYLRETVFDKVLKMTNSVLLPRVGATFNINEDGSVGNVTISTPSLFPEVDLLLLQALQKMPRWQPAKNARGENVKQTFIMRIPFGGGGC